MDGLCKQSLDMGWLHPKAHGVITVCWCQEVGWRGKPSSCLLGGEGCGRCAGEALPCVSGENCCRGALHREQRKLLNTERKKEIAFLTSPSLLAKSNNLDPGTWVCSEELRSAWNCAGRNRKRKVVRQKQSRKCSNGCVPGREPQ